MNFQERTYLGDPVNAVKIFNRKRIDELSILDIGATKKQREPDFELLRDIASEAFMPLSYGGGITSAAQVQELLAIGFEKVVINTGLKTNPQMVQTVSARFGSQSIVASIDAKWNARKEQYQCAIKDGAELLDCTPVALAQEAERLGAGEIMLNSMDRDGRMSGYDLSLVQSVVDAVTIPVTAIGGAGGIHDLKRVLEEGHAHAAAGGSMFVYYGRLKAVLITAPSEKELIAHGIYSGESEKKLF